METGSGRAVEVAPFILGCAEGIFVVSRPVAGLDQGVGPAADRRGPRRIATRIAVHHNHFRVREELPDRPQPGTVGLVLAEGTGSVNPRCRQAFCGPPAAGPVDAASASETMPSLPECSGAASGCVLLPGLPHLGLEHRAAWVEAESDGTITSMVSRVGVDPISHPDTAILAMLLCRIALFGHR